MVRRDDGRLVVLDHDERVPQIAQPDQGVQEPAIVALMETDGGLVEDVQDAHEPAADLRGQPDALGLAASKGAGGAAQRQVVETDVDQEAEPGADLLHEPRGDHLLPFAETHVAGEREGVTDRQIRDVRDVAVPDGDGQRLRAETLALARAARDLAHELLQLLPGRVRFGLAVAPLDVREDPFEGRPVRTLPPVPVLVLDVDRLL